MTKEEFTDTPMIYIRWFDHCSYNKTGQGWVYIDELLKITPYVEVYTVGFLLKETPEAYTIGLCVSEEGAVNGNISILKTDVKEVQYLRQDKRQKAS